jgi:hypothetical protein
MMRRYFVVFSIILTLILLHKPASAANRYFHQANGGWYRVEDSKRYGYTGFESIFITERDTLINTTKELFKLTRIKAINNAAKVYVVMRSPKLGICENDHIRFHDEYDNMLFGIIIAIGQLKAAYQLQKTIIKELP